jgi:hypothetical protein
MHEYDVALKNILTRPGSSVLAQLTGASSLKWINVEAPKVSNRRVDLLGELPDGNLVHIELQSTNERDFPMRLSTSSALDGSTADCRGRLPCTSAKRRWA